MADVKMLFKNKKVLKITLSCVLLVALICSATLLGIRYIPRRPFEDITLTYAECYLLYPMAITNSENGPLSQLPLVFEGDALLQLEALVRQIKCYGLPKQWEDALYLQATVLHMTLESGEELFLIGLGYRNGKGDPYLRLGENGAYLRTEKGGAFGSILNLYDEKRWIANGLEQP